ncbi:hypothetical protein ACM46_07185 [Chryseobacterium angstadtii]|uniref:Uncharacterized protein n=1 Tax=Chryseobacterium angstadtii TaxID=558151 RepID=A0A0J7L9G3_9FLAO|nr:hypothetical protein [Chryseobacterium angstadtii]KMQ65650.1 hypothetical protein ACM46_07185 [Chryseobacterium angstadtii]
MLSRKIVIQSALICSAFLFFSCHKNNDPAFFNGEWISDSLVTRQNDHWREFLYFENGRAARTTSWGKNYLLNKNLSIKGLEIYDRDSLLFQIKVIDSNKIMVKGKDYYGSFFREGFEKNEMKTAVSIAEKTEKQRKKLIGAWKVITHKTIPLSASPESKMMAEYLQDEKMANVPLQDIKSISFNDNEFSFDYNNKTIAFGYTAEPDKISFGSGCIIYSMNYYFQDEKLFIEYQRTPGFLHRLIFEKAR